MSQTTTLVLLPQTVFAGIPGQGTTVVGTTQNAAAYYLGNKDLQTVNVKLAGVTGDIIIEASLVTTPTSADWFSVYTLSANAISNVNSTISTFANITGNFVHVRARVDNFAQGIIEFVKMSY